LGEDGPTHQPVEHLAALRVIPGLDVVRPADANETAVVWRTILQHTERPAGLVLSRQALPVYDRDKYGSADGAARGGYVLADADGGVADVILIATGSEVSVAMEARDLLQSEGIPTRVVSLPCLEWFAEQTHAYRDEVLPPAVTSRDPWKPAYPRVGAKSSAPEAKSSASTTTVRLPTPPLSIKNSASPPRRSRTPPDDPEPQHRGSQYDHRRQH
jgi:transketolase